jgi:hypothetical protein
VEPLGERRREVSLLSDACIAVPMEARGVPSRAAVR